MTCTTPGFVKGTSASKRALEGVANEGLEPQKRPAIVNAESEVVVEVGGDLGLDDMEMDDAMDDGFTVDDLMLSAGSERAKLMMAELVKSGEGGSARKEDLLHSTRALDPFPEPTTVESLGALNQTTNPNLTPPPSITHLIALFLVGSYRSAPH